MIYPFTARHRSMLGVDINSSAINILELSTHNSEYRIDNYAQVELLPNLLSQGLIQDPDRATQSLKGLLTQHKFTAKHAVIALPDQLILSRTIKVAMHLPARDIAALVHNLLEPLVPQIKRRLSYTFYRDDSQTLHNQITIVIVAAHKQHIWERVEVLRRAGLTVKIVEVESQACARGHTYLSNLPVRQQVLARELNPDYLTALGLAMRRVNRYGY